MNQPPHPDPAAASRWLNRDVVGMAIASFLSDAGHELVTVMLPGFLHALGLAAGDLGWIEGAADGASSFVKLGAGWLSDRVGQRKNLVTGGYALTALALGVLAAAISWPLVLAGRVIAWMARGVKGPARKALLAESVAAGDRGKAFGLHRAADTAGAVIGPLAGIWLLAHLPHPNPTAAFRTILVLAVLPGLAAAVAFWVLVRERAHPAQHRLPLHRALRSLPHAFFAFVRSTGIFGLGDFSHTLYILAATQLLAPAHGLIRAAQWAALLYVLHNVVYAALSFPAGALADRISKTKLLALGYLLAAATAAGLAILMARHVSALTWLVLVFVAAGAYVAIQDAVESVVAADRLPAPLRATGYGALGAVNGVGDFVASGLIGGLWALSSATAFAAAAALMAVGAILTWRLTPPHAMQVAP